MRFRYQITICLLFILAGLALAYEPFIKKQPEAQTYVQSQTVQVLSESSETPVQTELIKGRPIKIEIPSLGINLSVIEGYYNSADKSWTLTNDKAQYAAITPLANNQSGNTFIYGHRLPQVFGNLSKIKPGDSVKLYTENGHTFEYSFKSARETNPQDSSLFRYQGPAILTLQTCSGLWDQNRTLYSFELVRSS